MGDYLSPAGIDLIVTSPLARARQTAAPLAERLGLEPVVECDDAIVIAAGDTVFLL